MDAELKILLLSDTHGHLDETMRKFISAADEVWHAGDVGDVGVIEEIKALKPIRGVSGNIDGTGVRKYFPEKEVFQIGPVKVFMIHIGGYPPRYNPSTRKMVDEIKPDLFISGHSHILKVIPDKERGLLHINPGAAGRQGFHKMRTMVRFEIGNKKIKNLEVIELGKRSAL